MDRRQVYGGPGPPFFSQARSMCTEFIRGWPARGCSLVSPAVVLLPAASSLVSLRGGAGIQLRWGKASPGNGEHDAGIWVAAGAP
jgi:hypothetical protein